MRAGRCPAITLSALVAAGLFGAGGTACDWARDAAGLTADLQARYPGSRIEIDDTREDGERRVAVRIHARSFSADVDFGREARDVAKLVIERYEMEGPDDVVEVELRSEQRIGPFASRRRLRFIYPASEIEPWSDGDSLTP